MSIGINIKRIRQQKGLTQQQLGNLCNPPMLDSAIRRYESGKAKPKIETIRRIALALDVNYWDLVDDWDQFSKKEMWDAYEAYRKHLTFDDEVRHYLLIHYYDCLDRVGRDALVEILANFRALNSNGQKEAVKRMEELTEIPKYQKKD